MSLCMGWLTAPRSLRDGGLFLERSRQAGGCSVLFSNFVKGRVAEGRVCVSLCACVSLHKYLFLDGETSVLPEVTEVLCTDTVV